MERLHLLQVSVALHHHPKRQHPGKNPYLVQYPRSLLDSVQQWGFCEGVLGFDAIPVFPVFNLKVRGKGARGWLLRKHHMVQAMASISNFSD